MSTPSQPIQIVLRDPSLERERALVFFRALLLIPHFVWLGLWGVGAIVLLPVLWVGALILGRTPDWLHSFYGSYVRYWVHVYGYGAFAAEKYPGFEGKPGYAVDLEIPPPVRQSRWTILVRLLLAIPPLLLAELLFGGSVGSSFSNNDNGLSSNHTTQLGSFGLLTVIWFLGWFACMAKARMAPGMRDLAVFCLGYAAQVWGYVFLVTPRYPDATPSLARPRPQPEHPVRAALDDDLKRNRLTVLFRGLLFLPHLVWLILWGIAAYVAVVLSWFATLVMGRTPGALHRFLAAYVRYYAHVLAFITLVANPFPGFNGAPGSYPFELEIAPPERQNRWVTGFRVILAIPAYLLCSAVTSAALLGAVGSWFFALIMGRSPRGLRDLNAFSIRFSSQFSAYTYLLTDRYPYSGPTLDTGRPSDAWLPPRPPEEQRWMDAPEAV